MATSPTLCFYCGKQVDYEIWYHLDANNNARDYIHRDMCSDDFIAQFITGVTTGDLSTRYNYRLYRVQPIPLPPVEEPSAA